MGRGIRKLRSLLCGLVAATSISIAWAQTIEPGYRRFYQSNEFQIYSPTDFFRDFSSVHYPEMAELNPDRWDEMRRLMNFLHNEGISIGIGTNTNNHTIFELYLPLISRPDGLVGPTIGVTKESRVGNLYFIAHDAVHHAVGIPGPRLRDLEDVEAAKKKLFDIMLLKEQIATLHSMSIYIPAYWNWRDRNRYGRERPEFVRLNHGLFNFGDLPREVYVDMIGHFVHGRSVEYAKILAKYIDPKIIREARRNGVPLGGPRLHPLIGLWGESWVYQVTIPLVEPILARYREVGYSGFKAYSEAMADFMLQPWYVEWAERFQFGIPLDTLYSKCLDHIADQKAGRPIGDETKKSDSEFERRALMNEVALFGRRVAELREMGRRGESHFQFGREDDQKLGALFEAAGELHDDLSGREAENLDAKRLDYFRDELGRLMSGAEKLFPMDRYFSLERHQPFINYSNYWRDITGLLVPRYGHNSSALSTTDIQRFIAERREATRSYYSRIKWRMREWLEGTQFGKPDFWNTQNAMADDYEAAQQSEKRFEFRRHFGEDENIYLQRMDELAQAFSFQVHQVLIPQIIDSRILTGADRKQAILELGLLANRMGIAISRVEEAYRATQAGQGFMVRERRFNIYIDKIYQGLFQLAKALQRRGSADEIFKIFSDLERIHSAFADLSNPFSSSPTSELQSIFPNRVFRAQALVEGAGALFRRTSGGLIDVLNSAITPFRFMRSGSGTAVRFEGWDPKRAPQGPGHFILNLNHDQGLIEINMAYEVFASLGVDKIYTLTTKKAWGHFPKGKIPGENVVYIEDDKPIDEVVKRILSAGHSRVGILVCPEGILPSMYASTPIAAKPGAFVLARKLAHAVSPAIPVYSLFGHFNGHEHFTSEANVPLTLTLSGPETVPPERLTPNDSWVAKMRLAFENLVNRHRAIRQPDLNNPRLASSTNFPVSGDLRAHTRIGPWFNGHLFSRCASVVRRLNGIPDP